VWRDSAPESQMGTGDTIREDIFAPSGGKYVVATSVPLLNPLAW
jgi:hypothetical protein